MRGRITIELELESEALLEAARRIAFEKLGPGWYRSEIQCQGCDAWVSPGALKDGFCWTCVREQRGLAGRADLT